MNQHNDAIEYDPKFDSKFSLYIRTKDPLKAVTVSLRGSKKQRSKIIFCLTWLWYNRANNSIIKRRHTKPYKRNMRSSKLKYSTATGPYCVTHDVKVSFFMAYFSRSKILSHLFHIDNNEDESGIGYYIIIGCYFMVKLFLSVGFNCQFLQFHGVIIPMKWLSGLISQIDLTSCDMCEVVIQTTKPVFTRESN